MNTAKNLIAIGRSRYLYDSIKYLASAGYVFKAIITEEAYSEYDIKHHHFEELAYSIGARFFMTRNVFAEEIINIIKESNVQVAISVNWKYTIPEKFLDLFPCGILNFHLGNLPDYKGNATPNWTILNGEEHIIANIHKMDPVLDAGDIISRKSILITPDTYIGDILKQAELEVPLLYEDAIQKILADPHTFVIKGTVRGLRCYPRLPEDSQIDWNQNAEYISRLVRASGTPYPGAFSFLNEEKVIIWKAKPFKSENEFLAIPGHVVELKKDTGSILVACKSGLLEVAEIEHGGKIMPPTALIKSIRVRLKYKADARA